jgi:hypothetical protein
MITKPIKPVSFSAPAQHELFRRYGDPTSEGWQKKWLMEWAVETYFPWLPQESIIVHIDFQPLLDNVFKQLELSGLQDEINTLDEAFNIRYVHGSKTALSVHSWGAAIDMNGHQNPVGTAGRWSKKFLEVMSYNHIYCGMNWQGRKDPMHFAMVNG